MMLMETYLTGGQRTIAAFMELAEALASQYDGYGPFRRFT